MNYYQYKEFVVNYKPFEWEINSKEEWLKIRKQTIGY